MQLRIDYGSAAARGKQFTEENDRFLICMTNQLGYGRWDELRTECEAGRDLNAAAEFSEGGNSALWLAAA